MRKMQMVVRGFAVAGFAGMLAACSGAAGSTGPVVGAIASRGADDGGPIAGGATGGSGVVRLRCEARSGRSKISVDGTNLSPRGGTFSARVEASGGTAVSGSAKAVGDQAEFDFDSNPADVARGATRISATFITARAGADVVAEILNAQGQVVARAGADCQSN